MFDTVLVANRGEIAVRIMRTLRRLGIRSVAVYSDEDRSARHVRESDHAVRLGAAPAVESYLSVERLIAAAAETGAQAIHPGYGFLAESAHFANSCREQGIVFVGPPVHAIALMGDKIRAKRTVKAAGVAVVPGRNDPEMSDDDLVAAANEIGYPVLVKPSAGGGGKGMRLVQDPQQLRAELPGARREALASFGDGTMFLERFIQSPRHIEIQILADNYGSVVHLGERECSLQRRHQKIIEETPSVLLTEDQRVTMGEAAKAIARSVDYQGVGTVEFIASTNAPEDFFFIEMNTRLQVEHPVTELVTGIDLVEQQLRVAAGEPLSFGQADIRFTGHAIEGRVYAEDPSRGFVPSGGAVLSLREPEEEGVRVDSSLLAGGHVGTTYDPMLSKVAAWGQDRKTALARLDRALAKTVILGCSTNLSFLQLLLNHPDVTAGNIDTELVDRDLVSLVALPSPIPAYVAFAADRLLREEAISEDLDQWSSPDGWRLGGPSAPLSWTVVGPEMESVDVQICGRSSRAQVTIGEATPHSVSSDLTPDGFLLTIDGQTRPAMVATLGLTTWVWIDGETSALTEVAEERGGSRSSELENEVRSPMPGTVTALHVKVGDPVEKGQPLLVVEAMKMEYTLAAPRGGRVQGLFASVGGRVQSDAVLVSFDPVRPS